MIRIVNIIHSTFHETLDKNVYSYNWFECWSNHITIDISDCFPFLSLSLSFSSQPGIWFPSIKMLEWFVLKERFHGYAAQFLLCKSWQVWTIFLMAFLAVGQWRAFKKWIISVHHILWNVSIWMVSGLNTNVGHNLCLRVIFINGLDVFIIHFSCQILYIQINVRNTIKCVEYNAYFPLFLFFFHQSTHYSYMEMLKCVNVNVCADFTSSQTPCAWWIENLFINNIDFNPMCYIDEQISRFTSCDAPSTPIHPQQPTNFAQIHAIPKTKHIQSKFILNRLNKFA